MPKLDQALTRRVADLARLELSDAEVAQFTDQLADILGYVEQLSEVNVDGIGPLTQPAVESETGWRDDSVKPWGKNEAERPVVESAPDSTDDCYKVPQIL